MKMKYTGRDANNYKKYRDEEMTRLEKGFVTCSDLMTVTNFDDETDQEGFYVIPSSGYGVIGRYKTLKDMENDAPNIIVRKSVYEKLCEADRMLKRKPSYRNCQIIVTYGYRSPRIQRKFYDDIYGQRKKENPEIREEDLREIVHRAIAYPEVAGHPTGGAVDVIIYDFKKRKFLDFGTEICEFETKNIYYDAKDISDNAKNNRKVLRTIMCQQGFAPYDGEWWHFCYGDREWAFYYARRFRRNLRQEYTPVALYRQKDFDEISEILYSDQVKTHINSKEQENRLKLAIQKEGRLTDKSLEILDKVGIHIARDTRGFMTKAIDFPIDVLFVRDDDIPDLVDAGMADIGILGENIYREKECKSDIVKYLGFGKCFLALAVPVNSNIRTLQDLSGKRIATSYRKMTENFLEDKNIENVTIVDISGSVELAPVIDYADAIVDLVSSGSSLKQNNLEVRFNLLNSQSVLIKSKNIKCSDPKQALISTLTERMDAYFLARKYKKLSVMVPKEMMDEVTQILFSQSMSTTTGEQTPIRYSTVTPIFNNSQWFSVQSFIRSDSLWDIITKLKQCGVKSIVYTDLEGFVDCDSISEQ